MPRLPHALTRLGATVAVATLLAACSGAEDTGDVEVEAVDLTPAQAEACTDLLAAVPDELGDLASRDVTPRKAWGRAWGSPAVVLTCGASMPEGFQPGASCEEVNGVGWYVPTEQFSDLSADLTVYTIGRDPVVELLIPAEHRRNGAFAGDVLSTLAAPVKAAIPKAEPCI